MSDSMRNTYPRSLEQLKSVLGKKGLNDILEYLHVYDGSVESVKPVAKNITIYWVGRLANAAIIRTEGEDDIILSRIGDKAVPTLIFRKMKAVLLRSYMKVMRNGWLRYRDKVINNVIKASNFNNIYKTDYDFMSCSISPGIEEKRGVAEGYMKSRCMKCPVDVLMGAVSGDTPYNLASRVLGDPAFATTESYEQRTGNAVDEIAHTTIMGEASEETRTGALYTETLVMPGTLFVGKTVLFMASPPELVYTLYIMASVNRYGARKEIWGTMEVYPVAIVGDVFEAGTAYSAAESVLGKTSLSKVAEEVAKYAEDTGSSRSVVVKLGLNGASKILKVDVEDENLYLEAWRSAANYVKALNEYVKRR